MAGLANLLMVLAFAGAAVYAATYHLLRLAWWRSDIGRNMMAFAVAETAVLGPSVLALVFGDFRGRPVLTLLGLAGFVFASWWRWVVLLRAVTRPDEEKEA